jgi:P27 family predicted phage terminase small subunit
MARGRKAQPAAVKEARGNPGRRRIPKAAAVEERDLGGYPDWLDTSAVGTERAIAISALAIEAWRRLKPDLERMKLLKATDGDAFARYCRYLGEFVYFTRYLDEHGATYEAKAGTGETLWRPRQENRIRKDCEQALKDLGDSMGLTPAARLRIVQQLAAAPGQQPNLPLGEQAKGNPATANREAGGKPFSGGAGPIRAGLLN